MKPCYFLLLLQSLAFPLLAQFTDDFSAATLADHWQGETDKFRIRTGELQLFNDGSSGGTTVLYATVPTSTAAETTWRLQLRNEFAPSSSNFATVYLVVNQPPVPDSPLEGYYLKIGGVSGTVDRVQLYRQDGNSSELLLEGDEGAVGDNPVLLGVEVRRTTAGEWSLQMDYSGGTDYDPQGGTTIDNTYPEGLYFGLSCDYTSTRDTSFFFDNIFVAPVVVDEAAPVAESVTATGPNELTVQVNEPLSSAVLIAANYTVNNGIGTAQSVNFENGDPTRLVLSFSNSFVNLTNYELQISSLVDLAENASGLQVLNFEFLLPELAAPGDLIFTEIFADPTPSLGLPDFEYVEIYNASDKVINLLGYGLSTGATPRIIDDYLLLPNSYVTLCDRDAADDLSAFGPVATLASFPALTNGGDDLILLAENTVISELTYSIDWFVDPVKAAGGYSLELIDPSVSGACPGNWRGSESGNGGTPGTQNSLFGAALETDPPLLLTAFAATSTEIVLQFDDVVADNPDLVDLFSLSPGVSIGAALLENNDQNIRLFLGGDLIEGVVYDLNLAVGISDCLGNVSTVAQTLQLGLTQAPEPGELLLSEILFNPYSGGTDFVELYNVSDKILNLN
ncbi:MAG: lamin tail domain-containing protein, partial [Bacteroidota bacterium]